MKTPRTSRPSLDQLEPRTHLSGDLLVLRPLPPLPPIGVPTITLHITVRPPTDDPLSPIP